MSNWLADRLGVHLNLRPLAPIAGGIIGNMLMPGIGGAALGSALGRFGDGVGNNEGIGQAAQAGAITGGLTYGGGKALEALRGAFNPAASGVEQAGQAMGGQATGGAAASGMGGSGMGMTPPPFTPSSSGFLDKVTSGLGNAWDKDPGSVVRGAAGVVGGIGSYGEHNAQSRIGNAEADRLEFENEQARRREASLEPLRQALAGQYAKIGQYHIAPNPYGAGANPYGQG